MNKRFAFCAAVLVASAGVGTSWAATDAEKAKPQALNLAVPKGFTIELVAGPPLVERPIVASFDEEGRLYVAESSGSNDPVQKQLAERPHRIVRLEDADGDGQFDRRVVFADRMMFPEGCQFLDGSLYVSAPPSIWKLTDTDGDGVADERSEWFQGKTLTGCANDLHGPYLGPDGWLYWCKGAFAEQTHTVRGREWKTRAAHIFRCRTDGSGLEPVMTGGMDNPVDVVFMPEGERILSATILVANPRVDGMAHAVYGGVFGKNHGVLDGHARTGELMPIMTPMSPAAPSGLERYESTTFGEEFRDNLFLAQFNLRKVSRHLLRPEGSTFTTEDSDFVTSDNVDFHPTDVLMDADGSLLVLDTGGWYKLCCPTSQLWKPDVLGGIYRVRREGAKPASDAWGREVRWQSVSARELWELHTDARPAVRQRAQRELVRRRDDADVREFVGRFADEKIVAAISAVPSKPQFPTCDALTASVARTWTLGQFESADAQRLVRELLERGDESVRHAALNLIGLHRDAVAYPKVVKLLTNDSPPIRRAAAEALGRIGKKEAVPHLLRAAGGESDRVLQHSIIYALIELGDPAATTAGLASDQPGTNAAALIALDQMRGGGVNSQQVIPLLNTEEPVLREAALWLVSRHTEWGGDLNAWFRDRLGELLDRPIATHPAVDHDALEQMLTRFAVNSDVRKLLSDVLIDSNSTDTAKRMALIVMERAKPAKSPALWRKSLSKIIAERQYDLIPLAVAAARALPVADRADEPLNAALATVPADRDVPAYTRVAALAVVAKLQPELSETDFELLKGALSPEADVEVRAAALDALETAPLTEKQLEALCGAVEAAGPLELNGLLTPFVKAESDELGLKLLNAIEASPGFASLRVDMLREALAKRGPEIQTRIDELETRLNVDAAAQRKRIEELLPRMAQGDVRRGHAVFHSAKATCSACHVMGHAGGTVGPNLSKIGEARTERDLLESILYPSLSFVRSYEPVRVTTTDGQVINGTIRDETERDVLLATGPNQEARLVREEIDEMEPGTVSVMPSGLDGQLTVEELADLVAFLKQAK
jgi:putative membrane-bound dehydrogenase-like protein